MDTLDSLFPTNMNTHFRRFNKQASQFMAEEPSIGQSIDDCFDVLSKQYNILANQALDELKKFKKDSLDINSAEFRKDEAMETEVANLVIMQFLRTDKDVNQTMRQIGFHKSFNDHFVKEDDIIREVKRLIKTLTIDLHVAKMILYFSYVIVYYQLQFAVESAFGNIVEDYNRSKNVIKSKVYIDNLLRRTTTNNRMPGDVISRLLDTKSGPIIFESLKKIIRRNHQDGYNIKPIALNIFDFCYQCKEERPKDHIYLALYPLFVILYPTKNLDPKPFESSPQHRDADDDYIYTRDYKISQVKTILGLTN